MFDIIIVTYNAREKLESCISSIFKHTATSSFKLTVVDNNSKDGTFESLNKQKSKMNIIRNKTNNGFCFAVNLGITSTKNKFIALLDDDIEVTKGWLTKLEKNLYKKNVGLVVPKIVFPDNSIFSAGFYLTKMLSLGYGEIDYGQYNTISEFDAFPGPCWLIKRSTINKIGKFDEQFFPCQYEDLDYCLRIRKSGYKIIYDGNVKVIHHHLFRSKQKQNKNQKKFQKKWKNILNKIPFSDSNEQNILLEKAFSIIANKRRSTLPLKCFQVAKKQYKCFISPYYMAYAYKCAGEYKKAIAEFKKCNKKYSSKYFNLKKVKKEINLLEKINAKKNI